MRKSFYGAVVLTILLPSLASSQAETLQSKDEFKKTLSLFIRRDVVEAISLSAEIRNSPRHAYEFSAGLKSPWGLLDLPVLALDYDIWTRLAGPRISAMYRTYGRNNSPFYFGPSVDIAYMFYESKDFHACTHCGESVSIDMRRLDIALKIVGGRKKGLVDINMGLGVRFFYLDTKLFYAPPFGSPIAGYDGAYADVIGKEFFKAPKAGLLNGWFVMPALQFAIAFGGHFSR